jgi:hypothetical protein
VDFKVSVLKNFEAYLPKRHMWKGRVPCSRSRPPNRHAKVFFLPGISDAITRSNSLQQIETGIRHHCNRLPTLSPEHLYLSPYPKPSYLHSLLN